MPLIVTISPASRALAAASCVAVATVPELATSIWVIETTSGDVETSEDTDPSPNRATDTSPTEPVFLMVASHKDASASHARQVELIEGPTFNR